MDVLVTGALGFVGVNLARRLLDGGHHVVAVDVGRPGRLHRAFLGAAGSRLTHVTADLTDPALGRTLGDRSVDAVVHAGAVTPLADGEELGRLSQTAAVNVFGTAHLLEWCAPRHVGRFLYVSSGSVYGVGSQVAVLTESEPVRPGNVYGVTKLAAEGLVARFGAVTETPVVIARLTQPYGPMEHRTASRTALSPIHDWCVAALEGRALAEGDPASARDFTHIDDVTAALVRLLERGTLNHRIYNVSQGEPVTLRRVLDAVRRAVPGTTTRPGAVNLTAVMMRPPMSAQRLREDTGWAPEVPFEAGIAAYVEWLRNATPDRTPTN